MADPLHTEFFDAVRIIEIAQNDSDRLAWAFNETGNTAAAARLWQIGGDLDAAKLKIRAATTRMVEERLHESQQATSNMLGLAFALLDPARAQVEAPE